MEFLCGKALFKSNVLLAFESVANKNFAKDVNVSKSHSLSVLETQINKK